MGMSQPSPCPPCLTLLLTSPALSLSQVWGLGIGMHPSRAHLTTLFYTTAALVGLALAAWVAILRYTPIHFSISILCMLRSCRQVGVRPRVMLMSIACMWLDFIISRKVRVLSHRVALHLVFAGQE